MSELVRIWYVSPQRLCNFHCDYCVSVGDYAKSGKQDWLTEQDRDKFERTVRWIGTRPFEVGVRLATLGEPFTSDPFLAQAGWLASQPSVRFVELVTNGSLLKRRLPRLGQMCDLAKVSLWVTHHHTQISIERLIAGAVAAQEEHGCFVVINGLLFPDNLEQVRRLKAAAQRAALRFNLDLGYDPSGPASTYDRVARVVPILRSSEGMETALKLGINRDLLAANLAGLENVHNQPCGAGGNYFYIGIDGDVYPCSRYYTLKKDRIGNILQENGLELNPSWARWHGCKAGFGCCNKEDFLNLKMVSWKRDDDIPSLGWISK